MNCQDYEIALGDYVDGTLDERSRIDFEAHLTSCGRCQALVADLGAIRRATLALEPELPSPQLWTKLAAAFEAEQRSTLHRWGFAWRTLAASVARRIRTGERSVGAWNSALTRSRFSVSMPP